MRTRVNCRRLFASVGFAIAFCALQALGQGTPNLRFVFLVDTSQALVGQMPLVTNAVASRILSSFNRQIRSGEAFALWTYDETVATDRFLPVSWNSRNRQLVAGRLARALAEHPVGLTPNYTAALSELYPTIRRSEELSVFILNDGVDRISGTPFDAQINAACDQLPAQTALVQTTLAVRSGSVVGWSVEPIEGPGVPPAPRRITAVRAAGNRETDGPSQQPATLIEGPLPSAEPADRSVTAVTNAIEEVRQNQPEPAATAPVPAQPPFPTVPSRELLPSQEVARLENDPSVISAEVTPLVPQPAELPVAELKPATPPQPVVQIGSEEKRSEPLAGTTPGSATQNDLPSLAPEHDQREQIASPDGRARAPETAPEPPIAAALPDQPASSPKGYLALGIGFLAIAAACLAWCLRRNRATDRTSLISRSLDGPQAPSAPQSRS